MNEAENLINHPEFAGQIAELAKTLKEGWTKSLPPGVSNTSNLPRGEDSYYGLKPDDKKKADQAGKVDLRAWQMKQK